jgi:biopolymer transport protein ExbB
LQGTEFNLMQLFADGGVMMYPLVLCSLLGLGVIIAKAWTLWVAHRKSRFVLDQVGDLGEQGQLEDAIQVAEGTPGPVAAILLSGLRRLKEEKASGADIEKAVQTTGFIELGFLERGLVVLATVANVAPLMGFLGTVAGMISAFGAIAQAGQVEASLVAGGIKIALITTATGLIIAVPVNIAYNYFVTRIDKLIVDMEEGTRAVLDMIYRMEQQGQLQLAGAPGGVPAQALEERPRPASTLSDTEPAEKPRVEPGESGGVEE